MEDDRPGKIFVGGLNFDIDEEEFEKIFSKFGKVTEVLLKRDQQNRRSRGFGFITYENPSDALEAVKNLDKKEVQGKMIHVDQAMKPGGERGGHGGFRGRGGFSSRGGSDRGGMGGRGGYVSRGGSRGGFRGRGGGGDRGGRGGFGGRGGGRDFGGDRMPGRSSFSDDRRGGKSFAPRRDTFDRGFSDRDSRGPPPRRDDDRDRFSSTLDRDRYGSSSLSERRPRDTYSPPRDLGSYRDYGATSRTYSPPPSRDYSSLREARPASSFDLGRDSLTSRDPYRRDDFLSPRDTRDYLSPRDPSSRDYLSSSHDTLRGPSRDLDRGVPPGRDTFDPYPRDRLSGLTSRTYGGGSSPPRRSSPGLAPPRSSYSPPRGLPPRDMDRDRSRGGDYSPGSRRPAPYDARGPPPTKRPRPDDSMQMRGPPPSRGPSRDMGGARDTLRGGRGPPRGGMRDGPRDGGRPGGPPFRR